jgi:hypothetical protein
LKCFFNETGEACTPTADLLKTKIKAKQGPKVQAQSRGRVEELISYKKKLRKKAGLTPIGTRLS